MVTYDFSGRLAVVTGGARGIGRAVVRRLLAAGAQVAIWDVDAAANTFALSTVPNTPCQGSSSGCANAA